MANAMPHFIFGLTKTKFLGMFGYSPKGNIIYSVLQFLVCIVLVLYTYGSKPFFENGILIGGLLVMFLFYVFGSFLLKTFNK